MVNEKGPELYVSDVYNFMWHYINILAIELLHSFILTHTVDPVAMSIIIKLFHNEMNYNNNENKLPLRPDYTGIINLYFMVIL